MLCCLSRCISRELNRTCSREDSDGVRLKSGCGVSLWISGARYLSHALFFPGSQCSDMECHVTAVPNAVLWKWLSSCLLQKESEWVPSSSVHRSKLLVPSWLALRSGLCEVQRWVHRKAQSQSYHIHTHETMVQT